MIFDKARGHVLTGLSIHRPAFVVCLTGWALFLGSCENFSMPGGSEDRIRVSGRVLMATGEPPAVGHVRVGPTRLFGIETRETVEIGDDGTFQLTGHRDGIHQLVVSAPHHHDVSIPLVLGDDAEAVEIEITLRSKKPSELEDVWIQGNNLDVAMEPRPDGTWATRIPEPKDKVSYRIRIGGLRGQAIDGTQSDEFELRPQGGYTTVVHATDGPLQIVFDPNLLPRPGSEDLPRLVSQDTALTQAFALKELMNDAAKAWKQLMKNGEEVDWNEVYATAQGEIFEVLDDNGSSASQGYTAAQAILLPFSVTTPEQRSKALEHLEPGSPFWTLIGASLRRFDPDENLQLLDQLRQHDDSTVRAMALATLIQGAKNAEDHDRWQQLYSELEQLDKKKTALLDNLLTSLDPNPKVAIGQPVPDFDLVLFESTFKGSKTVSKADLLGSVYLIDFWGTWCAPCVVEIPNIRKVWDQYRDQGFQVLSVAVEESPDLIESFRRDKYPMPWLHHYVDRAGSKELREAFAVASYPRPILVSAEGIVLATDGLREEGLMNEVAKALDG